MTAIFTDSTMGDDARRQRLYQGDLFAYRPLPAVKALADFARGLIEEGFGGVDPGAGPARNAGGRIRGGSSARSSPNSSTTPKPKAAARCDGRTGRGSGSDLCRCAAPARGDQRWLSHRRGRLCLPAAPRCVVVRPIGADQLVAADL